MNFGILMNEQTEGSEQKKQHSNLIIFCITAYTGCFLNIIEEVVL